MRVFVLNNTLINTQSYIRAKKLLLKGAWEMPAEQVTQVFGDNANLASNRNTSFEADGKGGFTNFVFTLPQADITLLRSQKKTEAENALTAKIAEITPHYPTDEKVSFAKQEEEALKYVANPEISAGEIPCIAGIAKGRQMELSELVQKIMYKANLFAAASGYYMGLKQRIEDLADKAQTAEEMAAIDVVPNPCSRNLNRK